MSCSSQKLCCLLLLLIAYAVTGCVVEYAITSLPPPPVYNAIFSPTVPETRATFYDNKPVHLQFYIGPHHKSSAFSAEKWTVNPLIMNSPSILPLVVTMNCLACSHDSIQKRVITYFPEKEGSSVAEFDFVPSKELAQSGDGLAQIIFDVSSRGIQLDHILMDTHIVGTSAQASKEEKPTIPQSFGVPEKTQRQPDLVLTFFREPDQQLKVHALPVAPWLEAALQRRHLDGNGELRAFPAGELSENEITQLVSESYWQLRTLVEQDDKALQNAFYGKNNNMQILPNSAVGLKPLDRDKVLEKMYEVGGTLYSRIFNDGANELRELLHRVDAIESPNPPMRIRIETNNIYLPWQLLHPVVAKGPYTGFWGLKYDLSVTPLSSKSQGPLPAMLIAEKNHILFAGYQGDQIDKDDVVLLAEEQAKLIESKFGKNDVSTATTGKEFLQRLVEKKEHLAILLAYTHASSGTILVKTDADVLTIQKDVRGARLIFKENDFVRPQDLYNLKIRYPQLSPLRERLPFFEMQPIVFLNACETGTKGISPTTKLDFPGTFLDLGARGVIVTEAPVWKWFAFFFGKDVIEELAAGHEISHTLFVLRNKYMALGNPLGLLYSYYGNPNAKIGSEDPDIFVPSFLRKQSQRSGVRRGNEGVSVVLP